MDSNLSIAIELMMSFARQTGLLPVSTSPRRYLWTDAFAACNFLGLYTSTGDGGYRELALQLIDQVHNVLGRHRDDDQRHGWISGLDEEAGRRHPTIGGLRIGKPINERRPSEPYDERMEWERDGQYYHYLTKWMHALHQTSRVTGNRIYNQWAIELARTAHAAFIYTSPANGQKRMYWKMSVDLSRPLVPSMGQHDPVDGFITYHELQMHAEKSDSLSKEIQEMENICRGIDLVTDDPLGIGGLLFDAYRTAQMIVTGYLRKKGLLTDLLKAALTGMEYPGKVLNGLRLPADYRLAFRELGLSIGLHAAERLNRMMKDNQGVFNQEQNLRSLVDSLMEHSSIAWMIEEFWLDESHQRSMTWTEHQDINGVMLATSLAPKGFLEL